MVTETPEILADKIERANALLAGQRTALEAALATLRTTHIGRTFLTTPLRLLAMVGRWESDMARAPEFNAGLVLGFMGDNGYAPLIRQTCASAPTLAGQAEAA